MPESPGALTSILPEVVVDEAVAKKHRLHRQRVLHQHFVPRMRVLGFMAAVGIAALHTHAMDGVWWSRGHTFFALYAATYAALSWACLRRCFDPERGMRLPRFFLAADLTVAVGLVWLTGGPKSWFFFIFYTRVADQVMEGARWCMTLFGLAALAHFGAVSTYALAHGAPVDATLESAKFVACFAFGLYIARTSLGAEVRLNHGRASLRLARNLVHELSAQRQALEDAMEVKSRFLANMSHELRTPMNGIIGMAELARGTNLDDEQADYVATIQRSARGLLATVNDILDHSRLESGRVIVEHSPFSLGECLGDALAVTGGAGMNKGLEVVCDLASDVPRYVVGDTTRLRQVLVNLLGNAIKFTDTGSVRLGVRRGASEGRVELVVQDTGIGMSTEVLDAIFDPFTQAEASTTRRYGGTGLGLSIARQMVEAMGGHLTVTSEVGRGSAFAIDLPLPGTEAIGGSGEPAGLCGRVHLCIQSPELRTVAFRRLTEAGAEVLVHDGVRALRDALGMDPSALVPWVLEESGDRAREADLIRWAGSRPGVLLHARPLPPEAKGVATLSTLRLPIVGPELPAAIADLGRRVRAVPALPLELLALAGMVPLPGARPRATVVEDNVVNQRVAKKLIEAFGFDVDVLGDGSEAVEAFAVEGSAREVDVVFMDLQMPVLDGLAAARRIRAFEARHPELAPLFIVAVTANSAEEDQAACREAGMDAFLPKPIQRADLEEMLEVAREWSQSTRRRPEAA